MTPTTNVLPLGQRLAEALDAAHALIRGTPADLAARIDGLKRWSYAQPPAEFDRLLWRRFAMAEQMHAEGVSNISGMWQRHVAEGRGPLGRLGNVT